MAELHLSIQGRSRFKGLPARQTLTRWVGLALECDAEITLRFVGRAEARRLNRDYRSRDYATNVLTFAYAPAPAVHADVVLCVPVIRHEAGEQRKTLRAHLAHLVVHGTLHALGYSHERPRDADRMERREVELLASLGFANPYR